jgi:CTP:phosphocholine cytidylyltransferase-like protein
MSISTTGQVYISGNNYPSPQYTLYVTGDIYTPNDMHANDFILISDRRLKKNIYTIKPEDGLSMAVSMNPVTHQWKSSTRNPGIHLGFIADEIKKIHPSLVKATGDDNKYEGVLYNKISVINNAAIHALVNEIKKLRKRVKELEDNGG